MNEEKKSEFSENDIKTAQKIYLEILSAEGWRTSGLIPEREREYVLRGVAEQKIREKDKEISNIKNTWSHCYEQLKNETDYDIKKLEEENKQLKDEVEERDGLYKSRLRLFELQKQKTGELEGKLTEALKILNEIEKGLTEKYDVWCREQPHLLCNGRDPRYCRNNNDCHSKECWQWTIQVKDVKTILGRLRSLVEVSSTEEKSSAPETPTSDGKKAKAQITGFLCRADKQVRVKQADQEGKVGKAPRSPQRREKTKQ